MKRSINDRANLRMSSRARKGVTKFEAQNSGSEMISVNRDSRHFRPECKKSRSLLSAKIESVNSLFKKWDSIGRREGNPVRSMRSLIRIIVLKTTENVTR